ncbi:unnamed protein product, partial [Discosporangium mesarthrocarpum]
QKHGDEAHLCYTIGSEAATCVDLDIASARVDHYQMGHVTMRAWLTDGNGATISGVASTPLSVQTNVDTSNKGRGKSMITSDSPEVRIEPQAEGQHVSAMSPFTSSCLGQSPFLVVGVKSAVGNFDRRQALRQTWMTSDLGSMTGKVCLQFVVGNPVPGSPEETSRALEMESIAYSDLLTGANGLPVVDSYWSLVEKTVAFMALAVTQFGDFRYLMMADDDIYLRLDMVAEALDGLPPGEHFYAGQVWANKMRRPIRPQRDPHLKNYLPVESWPLEVLPPFATGPHYLLSRECVDFITLNRGKLQGVGTLEDVSVALWMLALQVHPEHLDRFVDAKENCVDNAVSLASLHPFGIRAIHANLQAGRPICTGYSPDHWVLGLTPIEE